MKDYSEGKIYKIVSGKTDKIYVGSTIKSLNNRLSKHFHSYRKHLEGNGGPLTSFEILKLGDARIELVENYPCNNDDELCLREAYWQKFYKDIAVNKYLARTTDEEKAEASKIYHKKYQEENKEKIKVYMVEYENKNKEKLNKYRNERGREKIKCECGVEVCKDRISKHKQTKKHINASQK